MRCRCFAHLTKLERHRRTLRVPYFFNDTATTEIYTLSLHDALPIWALSSIMVICMLTAIRLLLTFVMSLKQPYGRQQDRKSGSAGMPRPISYAVFCLKKKTNASPTRSGGIVISAANFALRCAFMPRP